MNKPIRLNADDPGKKAAMYIKSILTDAEILDVEKGYNEYK